MDMRQGLCYTPHIGANVLVVTLGLRMGARLLMRTGGPAEVGY